MVDAVDAGNRFQPKHPDSRCSMPFSLRKADSFKTICQLASAVPNFFAAEVPVQRFNEKENDEATDVSGSRIPLSLLLLL